MGVSDDLSAFRSELEARKNLTFDTSSSRELERGRVPNADNLRNFRGNSFERHVGRQTEHTALRGDEISEMQHHPQSMQSANESGALGIFSSLNFSSFEMTADPVPEHSDGSPGAVHPDFSSLHFSERSVNSPEGSPGVRPDPLFNDRYAFPNTREGRQRDSPRKDVVVKANDYLADTPSLVEEEFRRTLGELFNGNHGQNEYTAGISSEAITVKPSLSPRRKYETAQIFDETADDVNLNRSKVTQEKRSPNKNMSTLLFGDNSREQTRSSTGQNNASRTVAEYIAGEERQSRPGTSQSFRYSEKVTPQVSPVKPTPDDLDRYREYLDISADANQRSGGILLPDHLLDAEETADNGNDFNSHIVPHTADRFGGLSEAEHFHQPHSSTFIKVARQKPSNQRSTNEMDNREDDVSNIIEGMSDNDYVEELRDPSYFSHEAQSDRIYGSASKSNGNGRSKIESPASSVASSFMDFTQNNTVNIDDEPPQHRPLFSLPVEGNSRVVISALRSLQDKIGKLENERAVNNARMEELEQELARYKHLLYDQKRRESVVADDRDKLEKEKEKGQSEQMKLLDVNSELRSRNSALERQVELLNYVTENVKDENELIRQELQECRSQLLSRQQIRPQSGGCTTPELKKKGGAEQHEEVGNLPKELPGCKANRSFAEPDDVSLLEQEIHADRQSRSGREKRNLTKEQVKSLRDTILRRRVNDEKGSNQKYQDYPTNVEQGGQPKREARKKSRQAVTTEPSDPIWRKVEPNDRGNIADKIPEPPLIRRAWSAGAHQTAESTVGVHGNVKESLRGREIPFVVGTNVGKSYSVTANIQRMLSLVKAHNPHSCVVCHHLNQRTMDFETVPKEHVSRGRTRGVSHVRAGDKESRWLRPGVKGGGKDGEEGLKKITNMLEDELKHLKMQYQRLMKDYEKIEHGGDGKKSLTASLSEKIQEVIDMMELRTYQIGTLRDISSTSDYTSVASKSAQVRSRSQPSCHAHQHTQNTTTAGSGKGGGTVPAAALRSVTAAAVAAVGGHGSKSPNRAMALLRGSMKVQEALHDAV